MQEGVGSGAAGAAGVAGAAGAPAAPVVGRKRTRQTQEILRLVVDFLAEQGLERAAQAVVEDLRREQQQHADDGPGDGAHAKTMLHPPAQTQTQTQGQGQGQAPVQEDDMSTTTTMSLGEGEGGEGQARSESGSGSSTTGTKTKTTQASVGALGMQLTAATESSTLPSLDAEHMRQLRLYLERMDARRRELMRLRTRIRDQTLQGDWEGCATQLSRLISAAVSGKYVPEMTEEQQIQQLQQQQQHQLLQQQQQQQQQQLLQQQQTQPQQQLPQQQQQQQQQQTQQQHSLLQHSHSLRHHQHHALHQLQEEGTVGPAQGGLGPVGGGSGNGAGGAGDGRGNGASGVGGGGSMGSLVSRATSAENGAAGMGPPGASGAFGHQPGDSVSPVNSGPIDMAAASSLSAGAAGSDDRGWTVGGSASRRIAGNQAMNQTSAAAAIATASAAAISSATSARAGAHPKAAAALARFLFALRRQEFLELIDAGQLTAAAAVLAGKLKRFEGGVCSDTEFAQLCYLVSCSASSGVKGAPMYRGWGGIVASRERLTKELLNSLDSVLLPLMTADIRPPTTMSQSTTNGPHTRTSTASDPRRLLDDIWSDLFDNTDSGAENASGDSSTTARPTSGGNEKGSEETKLTTSAAQNGARPKRARQRPVPAGRLALLLEQAMAYQVMSAVQGSASAARMIDMHGDPATVTADLLAKEEAEGRLMATEPFTLFRDYSIVEPPHRVVSCMFVLDSVESHGVDHAGGGVGAHTTAPSTSAVATSSSTLSLLVRPHHHDIHDSAAEAAEESQRYLSSATCIAALPDASITFAGTSNGAVCMYMKPQREPDWDSDPDLVRGRDQDRDSSGAPSPPRQLPTCVWRPHRRRMWAMDVASVTESGAPALLDDPDKTLVDRSRARLLRHQFPARCLVATASATGEIAVSTVTAVAAAASAAGDSGNESSVSGNLFGATQLSVAVQQYEAHRMDAYAVRFLGGRADVLASGGHDRRVFLHDVETASIRNVFSAFGGGVTGIISNDAGNLIIASSRDGSVRFWDLLSGACVHTITVPFGEVSGLERSVNGVELVTLSRHGPMRLWDLRRSEIVKEYDTVGTTNSSILHAAFVADDTQIAVGSDCGSILLFHKATARLSNTLTPSRSPIMAPSSSASAVHQLQWCPAASALLSCSNDGTVLRWGP